jgi:hypothetical protein
MSDSPASILYDSLGNPIGVIQDGVIYRLQTQSIITDSSGHGPAAVKAASTAAVASDPALVVAISPNNPIVADNSSVSATGSSPPATATYIGASVTTAAPTYTTGQINALSLTTSGLLRVDSSGATQPVSGTITANQGTNPWTDDITDRAGRLLGVIYGSQGQQLKQTATNFNTQVEIAVGGSLIDPRQIRALTSADVVTANAGTGNFTVVQSTAANLNATITGTVIANAGTGNFTVVQSTAANLNATVIGTVTANIGTTNGLALDATLSKLTIAQGATLGSNTQALIGGSVTTTAPTYTTGNINPLSLTTSGLLRVDGSGVTQPVSGTVTANAGTGTFTVAGTVAATQSGTWTVQPGNTANTTPWLATINQGGNSAAVTASNALKVDGSGVTQPISGTVTANAGTGNFTVVQSTAGNLNATITGTVTANIGTTNGLALDTSVNGILLAQGSTTSGEKGPIIQGAVTTSAPTYTTGNTNPLSLTTGGLLRVDGSGVTQPVSGTITANQGGTWTIQPGNTANTTPWLATINQGGNSAAVTASNALKVDGSGVTQPVSGTVAANQNGTWTVQPGNTANTTPWLATINQGGNSASVTASNALKVDGSGVTQPVSGTVTANAGTGTFTVGGTVTANAGTGTFTVGGTVTSNQGTAAILSGAWPVEVTDGSNVLGTSSHPIRIDPTGTTTQPISGTVTANIGTTNGLALDTSVNGLLVAQGSSTSGESGTLIQGAVTTSAPSYSTGKTNPLSLTTSGSLRVDGSGATQPISGTITSNQGTNPWVNNISQFGGNNVATGTGASGVGIPRVTVSNDSNILATQSGTWNINSTVQDVVASGSLGSLNATVQITTAGLAAVGMQLAAGTLIGTIVAEISIDSGTTWNATGFVDVATNIFSSQVIFLSNNTATAKMLLGTAGSGLMRVRVSSYTSGTANVTLRAADIVGGVVNVQGVPNGKSLPISVGDSSSNDAFSRLRISSPTTLFDTQQQYGDDTTIWETSTTGTGATITNLLNESTVQMTTGATTNGNQVIRQTKVYHRYEPGKSQMAVMTFVFDGGAVTNVTRRIGYFDANNGIYLEQAGSTVNFVRRTFTSGSVVNNAVAQASWNVDTFDGTGPSGITLDLSKTQILVIDLQWLGTGRVRCGFDINGIIYYAHQFLNANALTTVYMTTANLPIRAEIFNTGTAGNIATMRQICAMVTSEGGVEIGRAKQYSANVGGAGRSISSGTTVPLLSIRAKTTGPNSVRNSGQILPKSYEIDVLGLNQIFWQIILNPTSLTGASFTAFNSSISITEVDISATAFTGGTVIDSGYLNASSSFKGTVDSTIIKDLVLVYSGLLNAQDVLTVVGTAEGGNTTGFASLTWLELF